MSNKLFSVTGTVHRARGLPNKEDGVYCKVRLEQYVCYIVLSHSCFFSRDRNVVYGLDRKFIVISIHFLTGVYKCSLKCFFFVCVWFFPMLWMICVVSLPLTLSCVCFDTGSKFLDVISSGTIAESVSSLGQGFSGSRLWYPPLIPPLTPDLRWVLYIASVATKSCLHSHWPFCGPVKMTVPVSFSQLPLYNVVILHSVCWDLAVFW